MSSSEPTAVGMVERPEEIAGRLRAIGQRVTPQRLAILGVLRAGMHFSADEVFAQVEAALPGVNRSTVYRTLEMLRDLGLVSETDLGGGARQFERIEGRHHHLICRGCGEQVELDDALVEPLRSAIASNYGFNAGIEHLAVFGRCKGCGA